MPLSPNINSREFDKFRDGPSGTAVGVIVEGGINDSSAEFSTNDLAEAAPLTYIGKSNGTDWEVQRIDETSGLAIRYANIENNPSVLTYADAWAARASLAYAPR